MLMFTEAQTSHSIVVIVATEDRDATSLTMLK